MLLKFFQSLLFIMDRTVKPPQIDSSSMVYGLNDIKTWPLLQILSEILRADWSVAVICEGADQLRSQVLSLPPEERRPYNDINGGKFFFFFIFFFRSLARDFSRNVARKWTSETVKVEMGSKQVGKSRQNVYNLSHNPYCKSKVWKTGWFFEGNC